MDKGLSLNEIRTRAAQFVIEWRDAKGEEEQEDQSFIRDLLHVFGVSETRAALYQKITRRSSTGNRGKIDALIPGLVLIEMKSSGRNLGLAEIQALDYIQNLNEAEVPRFVLTSDFKRFRLLDLHGQKGKDTAEFALEELPKNIEALGFLAGYETRSFGNREQEMASIKAARIMATLYEALEGSGYSDHEASVFLVRTLFALYADDSGLWAKGSFIELIKNRTSVDGSDLGPQLNMLFQVMNQPLNKRSPNLDELFARFPYVNGGIFAEPLSMPSFDKKMRNQLLTASAFDWTNISPAIFGSLFQAVKSPEARRELGEHYTTETNILKAIEPLFLDELREKFEIARNDISALKGLRKEIAKIQIFDPACGCGNFLVVSYRELRQLELDILLRLQELGDTTSIPTLYFERSDLAVQLHNIHGIEIEEWPARIAQTALLLSEHQANMAMEKALGKAPTVLPLESMSGIHIGNSLRMDWGDVVAPSDHVRIVGNPPFIGARVMSKDQKADLTAVWERTVGDLDYVTGWFKKAIHYFGDIRGGRFSYVSTNSIAQGISVPVLFQRIFSAGWRVRFAHQTFAWQSEAPGTAAVHCVITGYDKADAGSTKAILFSYPSPKSDPIPAEVERINGYLLDAPDIFVTARTQPISPQLPPARAGSMANDAGNLIIDEAEYAAFVADPVAAQYVRPFVMGKELINSIPRYCLWLVDLDPSDILKSPLLKTRISAVKAARERSPRAATQKLASTPHLFGEDHQPSTKYLGIPRVFSEHREYATCGYLEPTVIAGDKVYTCEDPDGFVFGVISSSMFITWQKAVGGRLKSDPSFSNTIVWNNLPLPEVPGDLHEAIVTAGQRVLEAREKFPERSLADLYNPLAMDPSLLKAHAELDVVVDKAFGAKKRLSSNEERQTLLFESFVRLTGGEE